MDRWLLEVAIEARSPPEREALSLAIQRLAAADAAVRFAAAESGIFLLRGESEYQIAHWIASLRSGIDFEVGAPLVAYREALGRAATIDHTHKKQTGWSGEFARVELEFEPAEPGFGLSYESKAAGALKDEYIASVERGLRAAAANGLLAGFPVDLNARLIGGAFHDIDSNETSFQIAAQCAFRDLKDKADPHLLQPMMKVEVTCLERDVRAIIDDLNTRGGATQRSDRGATTIDAIAPLSAVLGYASVLGAITEGRASCAMTFSHYERVNGPDDDPRFSPAAALRA